MHKIEGEERKILKKYLSGRIVDIGDERIIDRLASTGLMHRGVSIKQEKRTAKTTTLGYCGL